ncbi:MAG: hypothetical protein LDL51_05390 [Chloroflexi bacterium]|nr:hypothetical protein [Chloroflexota bacterium]
MKRLPVFPILFSVFLFACSAAAAVSTPQDADKASGSLLFQDDFSSAATGWRRFASPEGVMDYDAAGYRVLVNALNTNFWATANRNFADVRIEADAGKLGGPDANRIGLVCRFSNDTYYFFMISSDGFYGVGIFAGGQGVLLGQSEMKASERIKTGLAVNHLRADCSGTTLAFYVNGFEVASVQDATLQAGDVGLLAGTFDQPGVDVIFDNFAVFKP